jgi:hypothetical protein
MKDTMTFIQLQELIVNLLVRVSALEHTLTDSNVLNVEKYTEQLTSLTSVVTDKMQKALDNLDKSKESEVSTSSEETTNVEEK